MSDTQRNFAIIALVALAIVALGQGDAFGAASNVLLMVIHIAFLAVITYAIYIAYKRRKDTIDMMPAPVRLQLQVCGILCYVTILTGLVFPGWGGWSGLHAVIFFGLVAATGFGVWNAWEKRPFRW